MKQLLVMWVLLALTTPLSAQWISPPTPGIPRTADGAPDLSGPAPRTADGHPDFTGLWRTGRTGGDLNDRNKFQSWVNTLIDARDSRYFADMPSFTACPAGRRPSTAAAIPTGCAGSCSIRR